MELSHTVISLSGFSSFFPGTITLYSHIYLTLVVSTIRERRE